MSPHPRDRFILFATAAYVVFALAWIFLSDQLMGLFADTSSMLVLSTSKGVFFVLATAAFLFLALKTVPSAHANAPTSAGITGSLASAIPREDRARWMPYVFAMLISATMLWVHHSLMGGTDKHPMLIVLVFPIIVSALLGGLGPGLVATALATLGTAYLLFPTLSSLLEGHSRDLFQLAFLLVNGAVVSVLSHFLRTALARLQTQSHLLDAVVSGSPDAIYVKDLQGRYLLINSAGAAIIGKPAKDVLGQDDRSLFPASTAGALTKRTFEVQRLGRTDTHEQSLQTQDGKWHQFLVTKGPINDASGQTVGIFGISRDITEAKRAAEQIRTNEERLQMVLEATSDGLWDWDLRTGLVYRSDHYYAVTGFPARDDAQDFAFFQRTVLPADWPQVNQAIEAHCAGKTRYIEVEYRLNRPDAPPRWMRGRGRAVERDLHGTPLRIVGTLSDITERKRTQEDLETVLNEAGDAIVIADAQSRFLYANPSACRLLAYTQDELKALHVGDLVAPSDHDRLAAHFQMLDQHMQLRTEWNVLRKDGSTVSVELMAERLQDGRYMAFARDLTEQKRAHLALQEREKQLARVIEGTDQGYWDWDLRSDKFTVSARWETMLGYEPGEMKVSPEHWAELVQADDLAAARASIERHLAGSTPAHEVELRVRTKLGDWRWILTRGRVVERAADGTPLIMSGTHTDITERKLLELAQREANTVFASSYEGIMVVSTQRVVTKVNPAFTRITGYAPDEIVGHSPSVLSSGQQDAAFYRGIWLALQRLDFWRGEIWNKRKNGEIYAELLSISVVRNVQGDIEHYVGVFSDITHIKTHEAELDRIAHYDPLTGLANRRLLGDRLNQAIIRASRVDKRLAVCYLDLDGFKAVNDLHGHAAGDKLLVAITQGLKRILRGNDTLARLGGDEFVMLLSDISSHSECKLILDRVLHSVSHPVSMDELPGQITVSVSASIGVSMYPDDNADADALLRHADQAMYLAKDAGKNRYHLFDPDSDRKAQLHRDYVKRLRLALELSEFVLYYQPKVDLLTGALIGVEALIRWAHPERGLLPPGEFLPHIDGSDLEAPLGVWVMETALSQADHWQQLGTVVPVSINISGNHLLQTDFHEQLQSALARHPQVLPSNFELEVLETAAIADVAQAATILGRCHALGVRFSLDDFGTGYSSLTYLRKLPVHTLKIDQSFVRDMLVDAEDLGIVEGVIRLAGAFKREVIAEGVETLEHGAALLRMGCHCAQGYGIARPMPADQLLHWLAQWQQNAAWKTLV